MYIVENINSGIADLDSMELYTKRDNFGTHPDFICTLYNTETKSTIKIGVPELPNYNPFGFVEYNKLSKALKHEINIELHLGCRPEDAYVLAITKDLWKFLGYVDDIKYSRLLNIHKYSLNDFSNHDSFVICGKVHNVYLLPESIIYCEGSLIPLDKNNIFLIGYNISSRRCAESFLSIFLKCVRHYPSILNCDKFTLLVSGSDKIHKYTYTVKITDKLRTWITKLFVLRR